MKNTDEYMDDVKFVGLHFDYIFDEREEAEAVQRGYCSHVWAKFSNGMQYRLTFYSVIRIIQSVSEETVADFSYYSDPGLIIIPEVTRASMENAVKNLVNDGYFRELFRMS